MYPHSQQPSDNTLQKLPQQPSVIMQAPPALVANSYGPNNCSVSDRPFHNSRSEQVGSMFKRETELDQIPVTASDKS